MEHTIDVKVIMLPTSSESTLLKVITDSMAWRGRKRGDIEIHDSPWKTSENFEAQHLYFTSDERPKNKEYFALGDTINRVTTHQHLACFIPLREGKIVKDGLTYPINKDCRKIIASTNPSLGLSLIPDSFVKQYVESNGKITDVKLQMSKYNRYVVDVNPPGVSSGSHYEDDYYLGLTKDNEVIIVQKQIPVQADKELEIIASEANEKYPVWIVKGPEIGDGTYDANHESRKAYYQGRLDEIQKQQVNTICREAHPKEQVDVRWTDEDMVDFVQYIQRNGGQNSSNITGWLKGYKRSKTK